MVLIVYYGLILGRVSPLLFILSLCPLFVPFIAWEASSHFIYPVWNGEPGCHEGNPQLYISQVAPISGPYSRNCCTRWVYPGYCARYLRSWRKSCQQNGIHEKLQMNVICSEERGTDRAVHLQLLVEIVLFANVSSRPQEYGIATRVPPLRTR